MTIARLFAFLATVVLAVLPVSARAQDVTEDMLAEALPGLEAYVSTLVEAGEVPGVSVAVVHNGSLVYLYGFGVREMGSEEPVDGDTVFQIASLSKPVSSTVVASIITEGKATWDSSIADLDPGFQLSQAYPSQQVTLRDLFGHRSGLPGNAGNELEHIGYDRDAILHRLRLVEPAYSFRAGYSYSNFGLTEGGVAAAKAAGLSWEEAADRYLFEPLGMTASSYREQDFLEHENRATLHVRHEGEWQALARRHPDAQAPAGGMSSSARDLAVWMALELGGGTLGDDMLIDPEAIAETHAPMTFRGNNPATGDVAFYGLGWNVRYSRYGTVWGHAGAFSTGARTVVNLLPEYGLGIVVMTNAFPTGVPEAIADTFFDLVFQGAPERDWLEPWNGLYSSMFGPAIEEAQQMYSAPPADASPALPLAAYAGTYANDYLGQAVVSEADGTLEISLGPDGALTLPLTHFDRDLFTYIPYEEMPETPAAVTFRIGPDGKAQDVTLEDLDDLGMGTLTRVTGN